MARLIVHARPKLWPRVSGAHAGIVGLSICGERLRYVLGAHDPIGDQLFWIGGRNWEPEVVPVFLRHARTARVVLDIGANCGLFSLLAFATNPAVRVTAWEPAPVLAARLRMNINVNGFGSRVDSRARAAGGRNETIKFYLNDDPTQGSLSVHERTTGNIDVTVETIDSTLTGPVDLVKIDVERHEHEVLAGMQRVLLEHRPVVLFEALDREHFNLCLPQFPTGYRIQALGKKGETNGFREGVTNYIAVTHLGAPRPAFLG